MEFRRYLKPKYRQVKFDGMCAYPFKDRFFGRRLKDIDSEDLFDILESKLGKNFTPNSTLGLFISYVKRRLKKENEKPKNYWIAGRRFVTNGKVYRLIDPKNIEEGWWFESPSGYTFEREYSQKRAEAVRKQNLKRYKTQEGRKIQEKWVEANRKGVKAYWASERGQAHKERMRNNPIKVNYKKTYFEYFGYDESDPPICEISGKIAVDIHHIQARGMGGSKKKSIHKIDNLMALTREIHDKVGDKSDLKEKLKQIHLHFMENRTPWVEAFPEDQFLKDVL